MRNLPSDSVRERIGSPYYKNNRKSCPPSFFDENLPEIEGNQGFVKNYVAAIAASPLKSSTRYYETYKQPLVHIVKKKMSTMAALNKISSHLSSDNKRNSKVWSTLLTPNKKTLHCFEEEEDEIGKSADRKPYSQTQMEDVEELFTTVEDNMVHLMDDEFPEENEFNLIVEEKAEKFLFKPLTSPFERFFNENLIDCICSNYGGTNDDKVKYQRILSEKWNKLSVRDKALFNGEGGGPKLPSIYKMGKEGLLEKDGSTGAKNWKSVGLGISTKMDRKERKLRKRMSSWDLLPKSPGSQRGETINLEKYSIDKEDITLVEEQSDEGSLATVVEMKAVSKSPKTVFVKPMANMVTTPFDHYVRDNKSKSVKSLRNKWLRMSNIAKTPYVTRFMQEYQPVLRTYEALKQEGFIFEQLLN